MRVQLLPSALGSAAPGDQFLTTFLINNAIAVDAGSLGFALSPSAQRAVRHVVLSHSHLDHLASLPTFLENVFDPDGECVTVHASDTVLESLRGDLFNDRLWPDFVALSRDGPAFLRLERLEDGRALEVFGVKLTPISLEHVVPTLGFLVEEGESAVVLASDTGPTERIWEEARRRSGLRAVFLDVSFPDSLADLARASAHLTPSLFAAEVGKLRRHVRFLAVHLKASYRSQVVRELEALRIPGLEVAIPGKEYLF